MFIEMRPKQQKSRDTAGKAEAVPPPQSAPMSELMATSAAAAELKRTLDRRLDHALEETFPASDPISVTCDEPTLKTTGPTTESMINNRRKPNIVVSHRDQDSLTTLATGAMTRFPEVAEELLFEMDRAEIVAPDAVPASVVQMGSWVVFSTDDGQTRRHRLVFPGDADIAAGKISILTPIGTALIGLSEGQSIAWETRDGRMRRLTVVRVEQVTDEGAA
jgi:regulator of nucleoside diphosphate kinase